MTNSNLNIHSSLAEASQCVIHAQSRDVLLVEDTAAHALLIQRALRQGLWNVDHVTKGKDALSELDRNSCRIVLVDLSLPDIDGIQLVAEMKEAHPELPILIVTSQEDVKQSVAAMKSGAWDYVIKSDNKAFSETIQESVEKAWTRRLELAESNLAEKCKVAELVKSERVESMAKAVRLICTEVNNPVSGLITLSEILQKKLTQKPNSEKEELKILDHIMESATQVAEAVQKLSTLSDKDI